MLCWYWIHDVQWFEGGVRFCLCALKDGPGCSSRWRARHPRAPVAEQGVPSAAHSFSFWVQCHCIPARLLLKDSQYPPLAGGGVPNLTSGTSSGPRAGSTSRARWRCFFSVTGAKYLNFFEHPELAKNAHFRPVFGIFFYNRISQKKHTFFHLGAQRQRSFFFPARGPPNLLPWRRRAS